MTEGHAGPDFGSLAANKMHQDQQKHDFHGDHTGTGVSGMDTHLGHHPIETKTEIPTLGVPIQLPGGIEGQGALSDLHFDDLGNLGPATLSKEGVFGLGNDIKLTGDVSLNSATSAKSNLNLGEGAGFDAANSFNSSVGHGGGGH